MIASSTARRFLLVVLLGGSALASVTAGETASSALGAVAVPQPRKPASAEACVEPVEIMRREHMNLLLHQRDATVLEGERGSKYSLVGCMDCHNPAESAENTVRYPDPQHFCAGCHLYASVRIDCFECHADRGLGEPRQSLLQESTDGDLLSMQTLQNRLEQAVGE